MAGGGKCCEACSGWRSGLSFKYGDKIRKASLKADI